MKINPIQRLFIRTVVFPVALLFAFFIAGGLFLYLFAYPYVLKNVHSSYLTTYLSEKRHSIDLWTKKYKEELEKISKLDVVKNYVLTFIGESGAVSENKKDKTVELNINKILEDEMASKRFRLIAILSNEGTVLKSTNPEFIDEEWLSRPVFENIVTFLKGATAIGFHESKRSDSGLVFLAPIMGNNSDIIGFIYAATDTKEMANFLKAQHNIYSSLKIELIDKDGSVVLTKDGVPRKKEKYNIESSLGVLDINDSSLKLIAVVNKHEIQKPLILVLLIYSLFGFIIIISIMIYNLRLMKKIRTLISPLSEKPHITKDVSEKSKASPQNNILDMLLHQKASNEFKNVLSSILSDSEMILRSKNNLTESSLRSLIKMKTNISEILWLINSLSEISQITNNSNETYEKFNLCELLKEVDNSSKDLAAAKAVELIFDCPDVFRNNPITADRNCLKNLLQNLISAAIKSTDAGTVTLLASQVVDEEIRFLEVSVADTGKGYKSIAATPMEISDDMLESMYNGINDYLELLEYASISLSKRLADCMKGRLTAESIMGRGSVFTVRIPLKH